MKAYSNKTGRIKVPYSNSKVLKGWGRSAKKAKRKEGKDLIRNSIK